MKKNLADSLDLRAIDRTLQAHARQSFVDGDALGFVSGAGQGDAILVVADNVLPLIKRGIYEQSLLIGFTVARSNHHKWSESVMDSLFIKADPSRLRAAGDPLPGPGPYQVYRGVAGKGPARRLRGYSWTDSLDVACWFANRLGLQHPAIHKALVDEAEVLAYTDVRGEREFICKPTRVDHGDVTATEIVERANLHQRAMDVRSKVALAKFLASRVSAI